MTQLPFKQRVYLNYIIVDVLGRAVGVRELSWRRCDESNEPQD